MKSAGGMFTIASVWLVLLVLMLAFDLKEHLPVFSHAGARFPVGEILINVLFVVLAVLAVIPWRQARATARERGELESIISGINFDALLVVRTDRAIVRCNDSVRRLFGYAPEEVLRRQTDLLYSDRRSDRSRGREIYEALERDGFHIGLATGRRKSGESFPLEIITGERPGGGGAVLLLRDITDRVRMEEERRQMAARIRERDKEESLGILAAGAAHDFRNLLTVVQAHVALGLRSIPAESPLQHCLTQIDSVSQKAVGVCRQMMIYAGKEQFAMEPLNLSEVVTHMESLLQCLVGRRGNLQFAAAGHLPKVQGDGAQIEQVVVNLVLNAVESLAAPTGTITVETGEVDCDQVFLRESYPEANRTPGKYVFLRVTDTGCGMTEDIRRRILNPFFTTKPAGHGLGLASVQGILRGHRGLLKVESAPGAGSKFTALFPCEVKPA